MARVLYGSGVTSIKGKVRGTVYQGSKYGNIVRWKQSPFNRRFAGQQATRNAVEYVTRMWKSVPFICQEEWAALAVPPRDAYREYLSYNIPRVRQGLPLTLCPACVTQIFECPQFVETFE